MTLRNGRVPRARRELLAKLPLGRYRIPVYSVSGLLAEHQCFGRWWPHFREIEIDSSLTGQCRLDTLCHEAIHAASDLLGLRLGEWRVEVLATALVEMFGRER